MSPPTMRPVNLRWFLFGDTDDAADRVTKAMAKGGVLHDLGPSVSGMSKAGRAVVNERLSEAVLALLSIDMGTVLVAGWRKHPAVLEAARRTLATPGSEEVLELTPHRITSTHRPYVELLVNGRPAAGRAKVEAQIRMAIDLEGVTARVRAGRLVDLHTGYANAQAAVDVEGVKVAERRRRLDVPMTVNLGSGLPLVDQGAPLPPPPTGPVRLPPPSTSR